MRQDPTERATGQPVALRRIAQPWTVILVITGLFHLLRGAPVDAVFFLVIAAVLVADAAGWVRLHGTTQPRLGWLLGAAAVLGALMVFSARHGVVEGLIVSAIGLCVLRFTWDSPREPGPSSVALRRSAILFTIVGVIGCLWEVTSYLLGVPSAAAKFDHPSGSLLLDPFVGTIEGRIVFTALWLLGGIWLLRRGRATRGGAR